MIKNIPNKYTQKMLLTTIDEKFHGTYDFFYLPIDFKNKCNVGYAFINMVCPQYIIPLIQKFDRKKWEKFNSEKVCNISYARIQVRPAVPSCLSLFASAAFTPVAVCAKSCLIFSVKQFVCLIAGIAAISRMQQIEASLKDMLQVMHRYALLNACVCQCKGAVQDV